MTLAEPCIRDGEAGAAAASPSGAGRSHRNGRRRVALLALGAACCSLLCAPSIHAARDDFRDTGRARTESKRKQPTETLFWIDGGAGYGHVNLSTFVVDDAEALTADLVSTRTGGVAGHLGLGLRFGIFTIGPRGTVIALQDASTGGSARDMQLWSLDLEGTFRIPLGRVEPHFLFGGGYSTFGGLDDAVDGVRAGLDIDGANLRAGLGLDWFATPELSIGARGTAEVLFLSRRAVPLRDLARPREVGTLSEARARVLEAEGSSAGAAYTLVVGPGLHF
jgi:hypothetical protein